MTGARCRPDSIPSRVAALVLTLTRAAGTGVDLRTIIDAYRAKHGAVTSNGVGNAVSGLVRRGVLVKVGGRHRRTEYGHAEVSVPPSGRDAVAAAAVRAVGRLSAERKEAVRTSDVSEALAKEGVTGLSGDQLRTLLTSLAHTSVFKNSRSHEHWAEPPIVRIEQQSTSGRSCVYWTSTDGPQSSPPLRFKTDAARIAVAAAENDLKRPATRAELKLWAHFVLGAPAPDALAGAAAQVLEEGFAGLLSGCAHAEVRAAGLDIRPIRTRLTSRGAYPVRYSAQQEITESATASCLVDDLCRLLRPADEAAAIERLRDLAAELRDPVLARVADVRRALLRREALREFSDDQALLASGVETGEEARAQLSMWAAHLLGFPSGRDRVLESIAADNGHAHALLASARMPEPDTDVDRVRGICDSEGAQVSVFEAMAMEANDLTGRTTRFWQNQVAAARRVRGARAGGVSARVPEDMRAALDRPDAVTLLVRACALPRATALVETAESLLGFVLREPRLLLQLLAGPGVTRETRMQLTVAYGLLGMAPPVELSWPNPTDPESAEAYLTAVVLGVDADDERVRLCLAADARARGQALAVTEAIAARAESGVRLGAVG